ncbi:MAG: hypothetical protein Q4Q07_07245, partial [Tissierellia bacterium]|nr:hypothetical protein [Tissierellia bacterium]
MKRNTDNPRDTPRNIKKPNQSINNKKTSTDDKEKLNSSKFDKNTDSIYKRTNDYEIDKRMHAQQYDEQLRQDNLKTERKRLKELASNNQNSTNSIESRNHKQVQKYQKTQEEIVHNVKPYDPLAEDMDNDGVIDRYDMDFRDSNVSYQMPQSVREDTRKIETPTTTNHSRHSSQERIANHIFKSNESRLREDISLNNPQSENISFKKKRRIQKFQKEQESYQTDSYDPLSKDMDNDGVIDRYDMDFRDSNVSYQRQNRAITNKRNKEFSKQNRSGDLKSSNPQREDIFKKNQSKLNIESTKELSKKPSIKSKRQIQRFQQGEGKEKQKKD